MSEQKTGDSERFLSQAAFARRTGVTKSYIHKLTSQGRLHRDDSTKRYDLQHPVNRQFVEQAQTVRPPEIEESSPQDETIAELQRQKLILENRRLEAQARKFELGNATLSRDIVPFELWERGLGHFASAISTNILTLSQRLGRSHPELKAEIEKETTRALDRTKETAKAAVQSMVENEIKKRVTLQGDDDGTEIDG